MNDDLRAAVAADMPRLEALLSDLVRLQSVSAAGDVTRVERVDGAPPWASAIESPPAVRPRSGRKAHKSANDRSWRACYILAMGTADEFRRKAEECRPQAEKASSPRDKAVWLRIAESWLKMAQETEHRPAKRRH